MKVVLKQEITKRYPDYKMGVMEIGIARYDINALRRALTSSVAKRNPLHKNVETESIWKQIFVEMKASPQRLPSVVSLWNFYEQYGGLRSVNYFVDAYSYVSLKHSIPIGGYDLDSLPSKDITLRYARKGDRFKPLGLNQFERIKDESEIAYYSIGDVICRYWNNKDSEITKVTSLTKRLVVLFDSFGDIKPLNAAMDELETLYRETSDVSFLCKNVLSSINPFLNYVS